MTDEPYDPRFIGYFGVIAPEQRYWQCYYLPKAYDAEAREFIIRMKQAAGGRYMPPSAVLTPLDDIAAEDQPWVGVLCSVLIDRAVANEHVAIAVVGKALHQITGYTHFYVIGTSDGSGTQTRIVNLRNARTAEQARDVINTLPEVTHIKLALLAQMTDRLGKTVH